jgi:hypothetical protein
MDVPHFLGPVRRLAEAVAVPDEKASDPPLGGAARSGESLPAFVIERQQRSNWCWAAVTASLAAFFGTIPRRSQCEIAQAALMPTLPQVNCCGADAGGACNIPWHLDGPLGAIGLLRERLDEVLPYDAVRDEIARELPPACRVAWQGGGAHFMVIAGWSVDQAGGTRYVQLHDPGNGAETDVVYDDLVVGYIQPGDRWTHSYVMAQAASGGMPVAGAAPGQEPVNA